MLYSYFQYCLKKTLQTALCSTVIDNPNKLNKLDIANYIVNFLETDTLLFQSNGNENVRNYI